jgi:hypothetical protein
MGLAPHPGRASSPPRTIIEQQSNMKVPVFWRMSGNFWFSGWSASQATDQSHAKVSSGVPSLKTIDRQHLSCLKT